MPTRLAFYRGRKSDNSHAMLGDWLICLVTGSPYSHVELLENSGPASVTVDSKPYYGPMATMLSSSIRDGGVRSAWRTLVPERWVVVEFDDDPEDAISYVKSRIGRPYGWFDLLSFLLPWRVSWSGSDFCSEVIASAFRLPMAWRKSPGDLFGWAMTRPGARIVSADELMTPWSAANG